MLTKSGRELKGLEELIEYYKVHVDGLPMLLTSGCTYYDPPLPPPRAGTFRAPPPPPPASTEYEDADENLLKLKRAQPAHPLLEKFEIPISCVSIIREIGSGQFGQVFEAWLQPSKDKSTGGKMVAVKSCKPSCTEKDKKDFLSEGSILAQFSHPNVLSLIGVVTHSTPNLLVIEYIPFGDLRTVLKACRMQGVKVNLEEQIHIAAQIAAGMAHLVSKKFVHRDLASRNVLLGHYCAVKIADFGLSRQLEDDGMYYR
jgi:hypothetical protein